MSISWRQLTIALAVLAAIAGLCVLDLRCSGPAQCPDVERIASEIDAGKREYRNLQADELASLARNLHAMAQRYLKQGDKKKAQRAIGAALELEKKIRDLRGER